MSSQHTNNDGMIENEEKERLMIVLANAVKEVRTMVVHFENTHVTLAAVAGSFGFPRPSFTFVTY